MDRWTQRPDVIWALELLDEVMGRPWLPELAARLEADGYTQKQFSQWLRDQIRLYATARELASLQ
jgi:hypothetical protein